VPSWQNWLCNVWSWSTKIPIFDSSDNVGVAQDVQILRDLQGIKTAPALGVLEP
jgi:hypothetical protein